MVVVNQLFSRLVLAASLLCCWQVVKVVKVARLVKLLAKQMSQSLFHPRHSLPRLLSLDSRWERVLF